LLVISNKGNNEKKVTAKQYVTTSALKYPAGAKQIKVEEISSSAPIFPEANRIKVEELEDEQC